MTDVEGQARHSTPRSGRALRLFRRSILPGAALALVASTALVIPAATVVAPPAGAATLTSAKAQAAQIEQEIATTGQQIDALSQHYDADQEHKAAVDHQISVTQGQIDQTRLEVAGDRAVLRKAAVEAYMSDGAAATQAALFSGNQTSTATAREYVGVVEGNLGDAVATLNTARSKLSVQETALHSQDAQAAQAVAQAQAALQQAQTLEAQQTQALSQVKGEIATLIAQQQAAAKAAAQKAAEAQLAAAAARAARAASPAGGGGVATVSDPPPPPSAGGAGAAAVAAAESQVGVPYVWGGETPGVGFDCSGLTAWAWGQAGVSLPHYSGAQMADSTPVPLSDLQPGDLLFYGPGGATHVAMYVGTGEQIEAPYTGADVWITGLRTGTGNFAGAGRP